MWTIGVVRWLSYFEYAHEAKGYYEANCPEHVMDDPESFQRWLIAQREKEKTKMRAK